jgi:hypothetical protein
VERKPSGSSTSSAPSAETAADHLQAAESDPWRSARRQFLLMSGLGVLGGTALSQSAHASAHPGGVNVISADAYIVGLVANPDLPGSAGDLILNAYLLVGSDGTGFGNVNDPVHPEINSHLIVLQTTRHGNQSQFDGQISRSNDAAWLGQPFSMTAVVQDLLAGLTLTVNGQTFSGKGLFGDGSVHSLRPVRTS